jgi:seryl-tRNA synthetase
MLDLKFIRENLDLVKEALKDRNLNLDLDEFAKIDERRRNTLLEVEGLRARQNKANDEISQILKAKNDAKPAISAMKEISHQIDTLEDTMRQLQLDLDKILLIIPNVPHASLPRGDASQNKIVRSWGESFKFDFKPATHIELAQKLDIIDFARASKITGSNFIL